MQKATEVGTGLLPVGVMISPTCGMCCRTIGRKALCCPRFGILPKEKVLWRGQLVYSFLWGQLHELTHVVVLHLRRSQFCSCLLPAAPWKMFLSLKEIHALTLAPPLTKKNIIYSCGCVYVCFPLLGGSAIDQPQYRCQNGTLHLRFSNNRFSKLKFGRCIFCACSSFYTCTLINHFFLFL